MASFGWAGIGPEPVKMTPKLNTTATSTTFLKGQILKYSADDVVAVSTAETDEAVVVCSGENKYDRDHYKTSSHRIECLCPGCYCYVRAVTTETWTYGLTVYLDATNAQVSMDDTGNTGVPIGHFMAGPGQNIGQSYTTTADNTPILIYFTGYTKDLGV